MFVKIWIFQKMLRVKIQKYVKPPPIVPIAKHPPSKTSCVHLHQNRWSNGGFRNLKPLHRVETESRSRNMISREAKALGSRELSAEWLLYIPCVFHSKNWGIYSTWIHHIKWCRILPITRTMWSWHVVLKVVEHVFGGILLMAHLCLHRFRLFL